MAEPSARDADERSDIILSMLGLRRGQIDGETGERHELLPGGHDCFCGCGRTIPWYMFGLRTYNRRGLQVRLRLERMARPRKATAWIVENPDDNDWARQEYGFGAAAQGWFAEGATIVTEIAELVHQERDPQTFNERAIRDWQRQGRQLGEIFGIR